MLRFKVFVEDVYSKYAELLAKKSAIVQLVSRGEQSGKGMNKKAVVKAMNKVDKEIAEIEKKIKL